MTNPFRYWQLIFLFSVGVHAEVLPGFKRPIYIQATPTADLDYYAEVKSVGAQTYAQYKIENRVDENTLYNLKNLFLEAQKKFLTNENTSQQQEWRHLTTFEHKADWPPAYREMIQVAWLRLAQLVKNPKREEEYITRALTLDPEFRFDKWPFSESLILRINEIKKTLPETLIDVKNFKGFTHVLVNGTVHPLNDDTPLRLIEGSHRFTWLSNQFQPVTKVMSTQQMNDLQLQKSPLLEGNCQKPKLLFAVSQDVSAVFPLECVATIKNPPPLQNPVTVADDFDLTTKMQHTETKPFFKKTEFWVGTAIVSGLILFLQSQNQTDDGHRPTHREGI